MNEGQKQAHRWYETLEPISKEEAIAMIEDGDTVSCSHGTIRSEIPRNLALKLIGNGARRAPVSQPRPLHGYDVVAIDSDGFPVQIKTKVDPIFLCIMPTGWWWTDRTREEHGDFAKLAFLSFSTLELEIFKGCPNDLRDRIETKAAEFQAMEGQDYQVSTAGQTIRLGHGKQVV